MTNQAKIQKILSAMRNSFIGDSLAMPVHWYYRTADIYKAFPGGVKQFAAAPSHHPSSIMNLHATNHGGRKGRAAASKRIVGEVILKGKTKYWNQSNVHYHHEMPAGENTLNAYTMMWLMDAIAANDGQYDDQAFLELYIEKMTAGSPQHPDTYAESYHRGFFANWVAGKPKDACGAVTHDTASIGGLVRIGPLALYLLHQGHIKSSIKSICAQHLKLTHPDAHLTQICFHYIDLIAALYENNHSDNINHILLNAIKQSTKLKIKVEQLSEIADEYMVGQVYSTACYITDSWPSVLYLALKYHAKPKQGLIANTNLGGDNVHRGSVLGFILGLANPQDLSSEFGELKNQGLIDKQLKQLI